MLETRNSAMGVDVTSPSIRLLGVEDTEAFVAVRRTSLQTDPDAFAASATNDPASDPNFVRGRLAGPATDGFVLGAFDDDLLVGVVGVAREGIDAVRLWGLYVRSDRRRAGTGRLLVAEAVERARQMDGVVRLELQIASTSSAARQVYQRAGFRDASVTDVATTRTMVKVLAVTCDPPDTGSN